MKKVIPFIFLSFGLAWAIWLGLWLAGVRLGQPLSQLGSMLAMWMPALAYGILRKINPDKYRLVAGFTLNFKIGWKYYLLAMWGPGLITLLGIILYFAIYKNQFSLQFPVISQMLEEAGGSLVVSPAFLAMLQVISAVTYAPLLNAFFALGEEIGWRGYLYPTLRQQYSVVQAHLITGLIWSLWHLPINLQGYNFGLTYWGYPLLGVLAMFIFCFSIGILLSWVMERTGSIWAPALLHGAINACAGLGILFQNPTHQALAMRILGPSPVGLLSGLPLLLLALAILQKGRKQKNELR